MAATMQDILNPGASHVPGFPHSPTGWSLDDAGVLAMSEGLEMQDEHWDTVRALQDYYHRAQHVHIRELHDALEERFHNKGGLKYVYGLFPDGPIAQGCRIAGLEAPSGATNPGFGSVV